MRKKIEGIDVRNQQNPRKNVQLFSLFRKKGTRYIKQKSHLLSLIIKLVF